MIIAVAISFTVVSFALLVRFVRKEYKKQNKAAYLTYHNIPKGDFLAD